MNRMTVQTWSLLVITSVVLIPNLAEADEIEFVRDIVPILQDRCLSCHDETAEGGLQLTSAESWRHGGHSGRPFVAGDPDTSLLWQLITLDEDADRRMPPEGGRLNSNQLKKIRQWITAGAEWPANFVLQSPAAAANDHWAFQSINKPEVPADSGIANGLVRNEIDAFVQQMLRQQHLTAAPEADHLTLLRRVTLDLTGLPPTPAEVKDYIAEPSDDAYEKAVDRLLASPAYGERWARPWLDLCHFADTDGYLTDQKRPVAWRYRQWLINALNSDLPFDQFTIEQLAGDLLPEPTAEQLIATGFLRNTLSNREGGADLEEYRVEQIVDRTRIIGTAWLGLTVGCSRCHDHKYDPLSQKEFFELYAFLDQADEVNLDLPLPGEQEAFAAKYPEYRRRRDERIAPIRNELESLQKRWEARMLEAVENPGVAPLWDRQWEVLGLIWGGELGEGQLEGCVIVQTPWEQRTQDEKDRLLDYFLSRGSLIDDAMFAQLKLSALAAELEALKKDVPWPTRAATMRQARHPRTVRIHSRGDFRIPAEVVDAKLPGWLAPTSHLTSDLTAFRNPDAQLTSAEKTESSLQETALTRLDLARWLVARENPLTSRVVVNRMWQEFFGRGLVDPPDDFGLRGQTPSHPALLDWLAAELMDCGWSIKRMHRLIVTSATYRQSSVLRPELVSVDPQNRWLARQMPLRLSSDQIRDASLFVSGLLETRVGGPSVFPPQPESVSKEGFSNVWKTSEGTDRYRRGLYTWIQRLSPFAQNVTFDAPSTNAICTRRDRSNSPLQALTLLNDPVFFEAAQSLAEVMLLESHDSDEQRLSAMVHRALSRPCSEREMMILKNYLHDQRQLMTELPQQSLKLSSGRSEAIPPSELAAWTGVCSVVLNLHEFLTRE